MEEAVLLDHSGATASACLSTLPPWHTSIFFKHVTRLHRPDQSRFEHQLRCERVSSPLAVLIASGSVRPTLKVRVAPFQPVVLARTSLFSWEVFALENEEAVAHQLGGFGRARRPASSIYPSRSQPADIGFNYAMPA